MNIPPAPDSPKNILNILNDDCIGEIFRRLRLFKDLLSAAETCTRFQKCAMDAEYRFKSITIVDRCIDHPINRYGSFTDALLTWQTDVVPLDCVPKLLQNFGHLIKSTGLIVNRVNPNQKNEMYELIDRFCGKTLKGLVISDFSNQNSFQVLKNLIESSLKFVSSYLPIKLNVQQNPWYIRCFPHLKSVCFEDIDQLTNNMLTEFLVMNPQLQVLRMFRCAHLSPIILKSICNYSKNLHALNICWSRWYEIDDNDVIELKALRYLRRLHMGIIQFSFGVLINMFVENDIPIFDMNVHVMAEEIEDNLPTLKTLQHLSILPFRFYGISDDCVINLVKSQNTLKSIYICGGTSVTMKAIIKILELRTNLTEIKLWSNNRIDFNTYNTILNLAKNCVKVKMRVNEIDIPKNALDANKKWLNISRNVDVLVDDYQYQYVPN